MEDDSPKNKQITTDVTKYGMNVEGIPQDNLGHAKQRDTGTEKRGQ
jgi:hypothetical protein